MKSHRRYARLLASMSVHVSATVQLRLKAGSSTTGGPGAQLPLQTRIFQLPHTSYLHVT